MIKAIIFDIDNTLIDFVERKKLVIQETVKAMIDAGVNEKFEGLHKDFSDFYWKTGIENQKILQKYLKQKFGKVDYRILAYAILAYRKASTGLLRPYPGAKSVLISLKNKGIKMAVLSDAPRLEAYLRICSVGLDDFFDVIMTKDDTKSLKPRSRGFKMVLKKLNVQPEECIMIGDNLYRDIDGAKKLGMKTVLAKYGFVESHPENKSEVKADFVAERITDLEEIVDKLRG